MCNEERFTIALFIGSLLALVGSGVYAFINAINWDAVSIEGRIAIGSAVLGAVSIIYAINREDAFRAKENNNKE